jgi:hypothetical protein
MSGDTMRTASLRLGDPIHNVVELNAYLKQKELDQIVELDSMFLPFPVYGSINGLSTYNDHTEIIFERDDPKELVTVHFYEVLSLSLREDKNLSLHTVFSLTPPEPPVRDYFTLDDSKLDQIYLTCKSVKLMNIKSI